MQYYIENEDKKRNGPFDIIALMRKARNGKIQAYTLLYPEDDGDAIRAADIQEISNVFDEMNEISHSGKATDGTPSLEFMKLIKQGGDFLQTNMAATVFSGICLLTQFIGVAFFSSFMGSTLLAIIAALWCFFVFSIYLAVMVRKNRMQLISGRFVRYTTKTYGLRFLIIAAIIGIPSVAIPVAFAQLMGPVALVLILIPGTFIWMLFFYAPIFVSDQGMHVAESLRSSYNAVAGLGTDNFITLYLLLLINIILLPLSVITLPITISAMCEVYDSHIHKLEKEH